MKRLVKLVQLVKLGKSSIRHAVRGFTPYALGIIVIGLTIAGLMGKFPQKTEAAWFDDTFVYRRAIRFGNTGATVTNQKVLIAVDTSSTSGLIQDERMQTDCDDTRFTDANGLPLQYYINVGGGAGVGCNDASTDYYVLMPRIEGGGDTLIYMYYGNYNAISASAAANFSQSTFSPTSGPSTAAEEIGTAPVLYWNFDEGYGTTANDLMIQRNNGTITGSWATEDRCVSGKCLQFNGSSHKVIKTYASDFELDVSSNSFTVSLWMRHASALAGTDTLVSRVSSGGYKIAASSGSFCFAIDDDASTFDPDDSACTSSTYNDSTWHQVTAVKNGTTSITLYVDGNQVAQDASLLGTGSLSGSSPEFDVGVDVSSNYFDGAIDEVKVYNTAKTAAQITAEYSSRSATGEGTASRAGNGGGYVFSNGLVGYWRMDEPGQNDCDGTNDSCDVSGNINHGAWTNNATTTGGGKFGRAVWFDGTTDYLSVADSTSLSVTTQVSLGLWINSSSSVTSEALVVKNNSYRLVTDSNSNPVCQVSDGSSWQTAATSSTALTTSTWYHVGCSYDGKTIQVFVNGVETGRNALASSIGDNANALEFGRDAGGTYTDFGGVMDEVRLYSRGLSPREIEQIYNFAPGPIGWWKMDENTATTANDTSGNSNSGTFANMNTSNWRSGKFGSGIFLDGSSEYIDVADSVPLSPTGTGISVSAWVYVPGSHPNNVNVVCKPYSATHANPYFSYCLQMINVGGGGVPAFLIAISGPGFVRATAPSSMRISLNAWHHLEGVYNGANVMIYIDGVLAASQPNTENIQDSAQVLRIGANITPGEYFKGIVDDVRVYNYARSAKQIVEDMLGGRSSVTSGGPNAGQTIYWKFDEQQGTTANNAVEEPGTGSLDGTVSGPDWRLPENNCKVNGCLTFSTATDDVSAGDTPFTDSLTAMTVSLWVSPTTLATSKGIVSKSNFGAGSSFAITTGSTNTEIRVFVASSTSSDENYFTTTDFSLTTSTFSHLAMVYDGSLAAADRVKVYKDGRRAAGSVTGTIPTSLVSSSTANLTVGESGSTGYQALDSHLDEVKIYSFALTSNEVLLDMNAGSAAAMGGVLGVPGGTPHDSEGFGGNPPVGWWKMDENTGTSSTADSSGNGNTGTMSNFVASDWRQGKIGPALNFNATTSSINATSGDALDDLPIRSSAMTVAAWIFPRSLGEGSIGRIATKASGATPTNGWTFHLNNTTANSLAFIADFNTTDLNVRSSANSVKLNEWNHVAVTWTGSGTASTVKMYVNGTETAYANQTDGSTTYQTDAAQSLFIGNESGGTATFDGVIDQVKVFNYVLTGAQIAYDYNRGAPVGWWKFDECQGNTAFDSSLKPGPSSIDMSGGKPGNITIGSLGSQTSLGTCADGSSASAWNNGTTGKMNASLDFDGTDDVATVANDLTIQLSQGLAAGFTIAGWVNADTAGESNVGEIFDKGTNTYCRTDNPSGTSLDIQCGLNLSTTPASVNISSAITTGSWNHIAVSYTDDADDEITVWVNGKNMGSSTNGVDAATGHGADANALSIGGDSAANFDGRIDDFRMYSYEMTTGQMLRLYNEGSAVRFGPSSGSP